MPGADSGSCRRPSAASASRRMASRVPQQVHRRVAAPDPPLAADGPLTCEVTPVLLAVSVHPAVVLVEDPRPLDPQVTAGHEAPVRGAELVLRHDRDVAGDVEHPQHRLPRRLRPRIGVGHGPSDCGTALASLDGRHQGPGVTASPVQGRVDDDQQVEQGQVPRRREQNLGRRCHWQATAHQSGGRRRVPAHLQAGPPRTALRLVHRGEHRCVLGQRREVPAVDRGRGHVGETAGRRQDEDPRVEAGQLVVGQVRREVQASGDEDVLLAAHATTLGSGG